MIREVSIFVKFLLILYYYYYTCIYNERKFSNDTESEALAVTGGQHAKDVDGLFEKVSFQTAFECVKSG